MKLALSPADKKLMEELTDPDMLSARVPYIKSALEGVEEMSKMMQDISGRGRFTGIAGMGVLPGLNIQKVAHIPVHVAEALLIVEPDILTNKPKFYAWLRGPGKAYAYNRKTVPRAM